MKVSDLQHESFPCAQSNTARNNKYHPNHNDLRTHAHKGADVNCLYKMTTGNGKVEKEK
jgi:hypothetical protein